MKNWTNKRSAAKHAAWTGLRRGVRRFCVGCLAVLGATALPVHAFQTTSNADGSFEYFFAAPSLDIRGAGDLDLRGLSYIEGVADGFRVGARFNLDWLGGENAWLASSASTWSGLATQPRSLDIVAGGSLWFDSVNLSLVGGTISLVAGSYLDLGDGSSIDVGNSGGLVTGTPGATLSSPPPVSVVGGTISIDTSVVWAPGSVIGRTPIIVGAAPPLTVIGPTPIPEPNTAALVLGGLIAASFAARRRKTPQ